MLTSASWKVKRLLSLGAWTSCGPRLGRLVLPLLLLSGLLALSARTLGPNFAVLSGALSLALALHPILLPFLNTFSHFADIWELPDAAAGNVLSYLLLDPLPETRRMLDINLLHPLRGSRCFSAAQHEGLLRIPYHHRLGLLFLTGIVDTVHVHVRIRNVVDLRFSFEERGAVFRAANTGDRGRRLDIERGIFRQ